MPRLNFAPFSKGALAPVDELPLVQSTDMTFAGSFRLPKGSLNASYATFNGGAKVICATGNGTTLYVAGHDNQPLVAEMPIPALVNTGGPISGLNTAAPATQFPTDVFQGAYRIAGYSGGSGNTQTGGMMLGAGGTSLIISQFVVYDAAYQALREIWRMGTNFAALPANVGPYGIQVPEVSYLPGTGGWYGNNLCPIPTEWQAALGGTALATGQGLSITARCSYGPAATVFNHEDVGVIDPLPGRRLLGYPQSHHTLPLATWNPSCAEMAGAMILPNTRTLLFFGVSGTGTLDYGDGTTVLCDDHLQVPSAACPTGWTGNVASTSVDSNPDNPNPHVTYFCYDPTKGSKGYHGYPYVPFCWAYDLNDLVLVKQNLLNYWEPVPYATWTFTLPYQAAGNLLYGACYDAVTKRIYMSGQSADGGYPVIHGWTVPY